MQSHRILLAASAVICSLGLLANSADASISHVGVHPSSHVSRSVTHPSPRVHAVHPSSHTSRSVTHDAMRHASVHSQPAASIPKSKSAGSSAESLTKSNHTSLLTAESQSRQLQLAQSAKHFTRKQASRVFAANRVASAYRAAYHRQSIIHNPWLWLFMISHHRINQQTQTDAQYLKGYRYGMQQGQADLKAHSRRHQKLTADQERTHDLQWQQGYDHGYQDAVAPTAKHHQPISAAAN